MYVSVYILGEMFGLFRLGFWVSYFSLYCSLASVLYTFEIQILML